VYYATYLTIATKDLMAPARQHMAAVMQKGTDQSQ
jgi:hypothetical protein